MSKSWIRRYIPDPQSLGEIRALQPVAKYLTDPELWHLNRRSVSGAAFIGLFCAFLPMPLQSVVAAALAVVTRTNLAIAVALVWITNPITIPPMFYFAYRLGAWLLGVEEAIPAIEMSWSWIQAQFSVIVYPLLLGSLVCGWVAGVSAFVIVRVVWRARVLQRWRKRKAHRAQRRNAAASDLV